MLRFFFALSVLAAPAVAQEYVIEGTITGHDGTPLPLAHASLYAHGTVDSPLQTVRVDNEGHYRLVTDAVGVFSLWLTGAAHHVEAVSIVLPEQEGHLTLDARLGTYPYDSFDDLQLIGDFNDFSFRTGMLSMHRQSNGTYAVTVPTPGDSLHYQVLNAQPGRSINGTMTDRYEYDGGGDYVSVVAAPGDSLTVVFDPASVSQAGLAALVTLRGDQADQTRLFTAFTDSIAARLERRAARRPDSEGADAFAARYPLLHDALVRAGPDSTLRAALYVTYVGAYRNRLRGRAAGDTLLIRRIVEEVSPIAPAWAAYPYALTSVSVWSGALDVKSYLEEARQQHPNRKVQSVAEYELDPPPPPPPPSGPSTFKIPLSQLRTSQHQVPDFEVEAVGLADSSYSASELRGRPYLIAFWATWCAACTEDLPQLRQALDHFQDSGFTILSLSVDWSHENVETFRRNEPMPWLYGFLSDGMESTLAAGLSVKDPPAYVLIGPDGSVLRTWFEIPAEGLVEALAKVPRSGL